MPRSITLSQLKQLLPSKPYIIDIREPYEFSRFHLPTAVNIPYQALVMYPERYLNLKDTYYLICEHGSVSYRAASLLESYGYRLISISDGYETRGRCY